MANELRKMAERGQQVGFLTTELAAKVVRLAEIAATEHESEKALPLPEDFADALLKLKLQKDEARLEKQAERARLRLECQLHGTADKAEPEQRDWRLELLGEKERATLEWIGKFGIGVCSKCRWRSGCMHCDYEKAVRHHLHTANYICRDW